MLIAKKAEYSHTQGTSPEDMDCGAAHFLIHGIACTLRQEGKEVLNLGGTDDPNPGSKLVKFKTGFGLATEKIELEAARFMQGSVAYCHVTSISDFCEGIGLRSFKTSIA